MSVFPSPPTQGKCCPVMWSGADEVWHTAICNCTNNVQCDQMIFADSVNNVLNDNELQWMIEWLNDNVQYSYPFTYCRIQSPWNWIFDSFGTFICRFCSKESFYLFRSLQVHTCNANLRIHFLDPPFWRVILDSLQYRFYFILLYHTCLSFSIYISFCEQTFPIFFFAMDLFKSSLI